MKAGRAAAVLALALAAPACFDVRDVDPGAVIVDDFDDGDFVPTMHDFLYWSCYAYNPATNRDYRCDRGEGFLSAYSLFLEFSVQDPPDGKQDYPGAGLGTYSDGRPVDFTRYRELVIGMKVQSGMPPVPNEARVYVELNCPSVESESGTPVSDFYVTQSVRPGSEWSTFRLALANMGPPPWRTEKIKGGIPACLRAIEGISISLSTEVLDGQAARGTFFVDGFSLQ